MRKLLSLLFLSYMFAFLAGNRVYAQETETSSRYSRQQELPPKRVFWGANLGLVIGTYTNIGAAPYIGYRITRSTDIGAGPFFQYASYRRKGYASYGGRAFVRQMVISNFFAQAEYEFLNTEDPEGVAIEPGNERINVNSLFLGGGYYGSISDRMRVHLAILINVFDNNFKPYRDPVIRIGFSRSF